MQGEKLEMRILFKYLLLIATGLHMADGVEASSDVAFISLLDLCLWGLHVADIKDGGISIGSIPG